MRHFLTAMGLAAVIGCGASADGRTARADTIVMRDTAIVVERFFTPHDTIDNVDSPAVWHGNDGKHWLFATAKTTNQILVYDAATGAPIRRVGGEGVRQLLRPNGIFVIDSVLLVVERDNHRVQVFRLPDLVSLGTFGDDRLKLPYGLAAYAEGAGVWVVYVTDSYETADEQVPPDRELGERVKQYRLRLEGGTVRAEWLRAFGDTAGPGVLKIVESIAVDRPNGRLLIAEELETDSHIKVYTLDGRYTGRDIGRGFFPQQAEGIVLFECGARGGYWVATDQGEMVNTFHVFDRMSFAHLGSFSGKTTRLTDGVALTSRGFDRFPGGAFYGSHLDGSVAAMSWEDIARALRLPSHCAG